MRIGVVSSEVYPFSKTGGLADVIGALPKALERLGHDVFVITPAYRMVFDAAKRQGIDIETVAVAPIPVSIGVEQRELNVLKATLPGSNVTVYLLDMPCYYDRDGLYVKPDEHTDYEDNSERFIALCRGTLELCEKLDIRPDIIHCNDWQTGLIPVYLKTIYRERYNWATVGSVMTIHNIAYQGVFWHWDMKKTGLPWELFNWRMLEYYGNLSFLKSGLVFADVVTTVSRTYAEEIQRPEHGQGLDGVLTERSHDLYGIVNGIDYNVWSPENDELIPSNYSAGRMDGKAKCKRAVQEQFGIPVKKDIPLIGMVARIASQKGFDLVEEAMSELMSRDIQLVILGTGEAHFHQTFSELQEKHKDKFGLLLAFENQVAHLIEAGSDMFLMPSKFEPCGLNQLYSLRYGTVPLVRNTGGLADTIVDYNQETVRAGLATGFCFDNYDWMEMLNTIDRARRLYRQKDKWRKLVANCMAQDWSWERSAHEYECVYTEAAEKAKRSETG